MEKICTKCKTSLPLERFAKYRRQTKAGIKEYIDSACKKCENKRRYDQKTNTPEKFELYRLKCSIRRKRNSKENSDKESLKAIKYRFKTYGLTLQDYQNLYEKQNGYCPICNKHQSEFARSFDIDHCHTTGKVRSLLCNLCNSGIGHLKDNITYLQRAITYLETTK